MLTEEQVRQLENYVALNLMAFHRGCPPSLESVYAALILSILPPGNDNFTVVSDFDPARMVGMAYGQIREMGHSVFIERLVDSLAAGTPLTHLKDSLDKARLHFCIMARVSWYVGIVSRKSANLIWIIGQILAVVPVTICPHRCNRYTSGY
jgi:hypothetical protein